MKKLKILIRIKRVNHCRNIFFSKLKGENWSEPHLVHTIKKANKKTFYDIIFIGGFFYGKKRTKI